MDRLASCLGAWQAPTGFWLRAVARNRLGALRGDDVETVSNSPDGGDPNPGYLWKLMSEPGDVDVDRVGGTHEGWIPNGVQELVAAKGTPRVAGHVG